MRKRSLTFSQWQEGAPPNGMPAAMDEDGKARELTRNPPQVPPTFPTYTFKDW